MKRKAGEDDGWLRIELRIHKDTDGALYEALSRILDGVAPYRRPKRLKAELTRLIVGTRPTGWEPAKTEETRAELDEQKRKQVPGRDSAAPRHDEAAHKVLDYSQMDGVDIPEAG